MDPTKPILDLYGDSFYSIKQREAPQKPQNYKSSSVATYNQNASKYNSMANNQYAKKVAANEPSYGQLQDKYQQLYQAYKEKSSKLSNFQDQNDQLRSQNSKLRSQIDRLNNKNEQLNSIILNKNLQLEQAYKKLQQEIRGGGRSNYGGKTNDIAIDRLQDGLRQAINSNFQILRQSALSQLKHFVQ